jgi:hypothetical protein
MQSVNGRYVRVPAEKRDAEEDDSDDRKYPADLRRHARNAAESEDRGNYGDDEKDDCVMHHGVFLLWRADGIPIACLYESDARGGRSEYYARRSTRVDGIVAKNAC